MTRLLLTLITLLGLPALALAQTAPLNINVGPDLFAPERVFQLITLITVLSVAPSLLLMVTCFTRIIIVFAFLRSALGLQTTPPNGVLVALALFMTSFIMAPTLQVAYQQGLTPYFNGQATAAEAFALTTDPLKRFMLANVEERDLELFVGFLPEAQAAAVRLPGAVDATTQATTTPAQALGTIPLQALIPAFIISELRRAFEIGFLLFLPFLVIDLAVASILMSMGMMMLPPVTIALPFKIIFFVLVDGWHLLTGTLIESFNPPI
jgi:flagellar biosynthesis protein FliP